MRWDAASGGGWWWSPFRVYVCAVASAAAALLNVQMFNVDSVCLCRRSTMCSQCAGTSTSVQQHWRPPPPAVTAAIVELKERKRSADFSLLLQQLQLQWQCQSVIQSVECSERVSECTEGHRMEQPPSDCSHNWGDSNNEKDAKSGEWLRESGVEWSAGTEAVEVVVVTNADNSLSEELKWLLTRERERSAFSSNKLHQLMTWFEVLLILLALYKSTDKCQQVWGSRFWKEWKDAC